MSMLDGVHLAAFYQRIPDRNDRSARELVDFFAYLLQTEVGVESFTASNLQECFRLADLSVPTWIPAYLTNATKSKPPTYVKVKVGYRLHAGRREIIGRVLGANPYIVQSHSSMLGILSKLPDGIQKEFLREAMDCYSAGCNRASIVLFWAFIMDHLFGVVLAKHLSEFNAKIAAHPDKRINSIVVTKRDDFADLPEGKFIEIIRSCGVISNDVRKILEQKLGIRNSAAHPSTVLFKQNKANEFFDDLVDNVYLKYPI